MALPSVSSQQIRKIEGLLQGWTTKLTWDLLVQRIETDLGIKTTRQTLNTYMSIKTMFQDRKQALRGKPTETLLKFTKKDVDMAEQIKRLQADNDAMAKRIERQLAFITEIAAVAKINPSVMDVLERIKLKVSKYG
jgi:SMC interacting uncharacterized protein involved in chromosome segregation